MNRQGYCVVCNHKSQLNEYKMCDDCLAIWNSEPIKIPELPNPHKCSACRMKYKKLSDAYQCCLEYSQIYYLCNLDGEIEMVEDKSLASAFEFFKDNFAGEGDFLILCNGDKFKITL